MVQLDRECRSALRLQPGYSGAPVVIRDQWGDAVVAMLAVASRVESAHDAYAVPADEVAAAWPDVLGRSMFPACPYRGLHAFTPEDAQAGLFVGRESEVARLRDMVKAQSLAVVTGPSGVGKSSLVAAGLKPMLQAEGWAVSTFRPGSSPFHALARALLEFEDAGSGHRVEALEHRAESLHREGFWTVAANVALATGKRLLVVADQFEEILSSARGEKETPLRFLQQFLPTQQPGPDLSPDVRLVCTLRSDFLPPLLDLPEFGARLQDRQLNLSPLDKSAMTRVIVEPALLAGITFAEGLPEMIAADASKGPGGLPLLEFALTELWAQQQRRHISYDGYHRLGGVPGALNRHAEQVFTSLAEQYEESRIRRVLLSMVRARSGAADAVRTHAHRGHLRDDWRVAQRMADPQNRLVVLGSHGPGTAEIAHEALIREWRRLSGWVDADADFQRWLALMEERAAEGDLLPAQRVAEAQVWLSERAQDIPASVADLVDESHQVVVLTQRLRDRSRELEDRHNALEESNAALEEKAEQLREQNRTIELINQELAEAHSVLEKRTEQLAAATRYKSEFVANLSHELRTPLNSLMILATQLVANTEGNLTPRQIAFAETIHGAGSDLVQLINDTVDLSQVESGRMEIHPTRVLLAPLLDRIEATFRPLAQERGLDFSVRLSPTLPEALHTDSKRLLQVLRNLLSNALKFTHSGGVELAIEPAAPAEVRPLLRELGFEPEGGMIAFSVADTGIGITPSAMAVIFEAFKQADGSTSRKFGGTGLGLPLSRDIARLLDGAIYATSKPDHGSTFTLYLPLA
ncbi:nSTAND1 domain-containing NTPase [Streptomyces lydicus]